MARTPFGYPGVRGESLPDAGTVSKTSRVEDRPYLCVSYDTEQQTVQPLRLAAGLVGGPLVMYASRQLPEDRPVLRAATFAVGAAVSYWSLWIWTKASREMQTLPGEE
jgi:hypothetical protein